MSLSQDHEKEASCGSIVAETFSTVKSLSVSLDTVKLLLSLRPCYFVSFLIIYVNEALEASPPLSSSVLGEFRSETLESPSTLSVQLSRPRSRVRNFPVVGSVTIACRFANRHWICCTRRTALGVGLVNF